MPYPNALMQATPRNALLGRLSDALAYTYDSERTQQAQQLSQLLGVPAISRTLDKLSYGEPLTTGAGGLGGTTRFNNDALEAAMTIAPMVGPAAKAANAGAMAAGRAGERLAEKVVPQIMERGGLGAEMLGAMGNRTVSPLDVYHGSPYKFDKFDASKIGTGEGAQAYGHGIYMAENPAIAQSYSNKLTIVDGKPISDQLDSRTRYLNMLKQQASDGDANAAKNIPVIEKSISDLVDKGNLYKVDLPDEKIAKMLDWDKPMSEQQMIDIYDKMQQSPLASFAKPFQDNFYERMNRGQSTTDGQDLFIELSKQLGGQKQVSDFLRSIDIPGIKYLDASSRGTGGTRNFVVFPGEEKSMTILERNGQKFDNSALMAKKFDVVKRDASEIFGAGAERFRYTDPASGGMIDVLKRPDNTASVLGLEVPEAFRGKGIGESLQSQVLQDFPAMMGQVSSKAAAKTAYRLGRRPPNQPNASLDDVFKLIDENSSVNLVSPKMQQTFNPAPTSTFDNSALTGAKFVYPQDEALRLAQQRASLPPAQGGLGLPAGNTPEQRAAAMGFDVPAYHGTNKDFLAFDKNKRGSATDEGWYGSGEYSSPSASGAEAYAMTDFPNYKESANIIPLLVRNPESIKNNYGYVTEYVTREPDQLRSRFAAFDPLRKTAAIAAAAGLAAPDLLAGQAPQQTQKFDNSALMK